jgi:hypothetical protein
MDYCYQHSAFLINPFFELQGNNEGKRRGKNIGDREIDSPRRLALPESEKRDILLEGFPKFG